MVTDYYQKSGLLPYLEKLRFNVVGYGCTTCIGNSGPLPTDVSKSIDEHGLVAVSVLSGNRNFEGRVNVGRARELSYEPAAGRRLRARRQNRPQLRHRSAGHRPARPARLPARHLAHAAGSRRGHRKGHFQRRLPPASTPPSREGDANWQGLSFPTGDVYQWEPDSTYIRQAPYFDGITPTPAPVKDITGARVLAVLGDSVTTDHISPAGSIKANGPAGKYLTEHGVKPARLQQLRLPPRQP